MNTFIRDKVVYILGIGSDIGKGLIKYYLSDGACIYGTDRSMAFSKTDKPWDIFISCIGTMEPIGKFFEVDFNKWEESVIVNTTKQLRFLHTIYPYRNKEMCNVVFFAGGGTNSAVPDYSAYCASKIFLIKMCELIDCEEEKMNIFIIGPGWVRTKIHQQAIQTYNYNYERTIEFLNGDKETSIKNIYDCINWGINQGKEVVGGRNISVVNDRWTDPYTRLTDELLEDKDQFKLRRFKND